MKTAKPCRRPLGLKHAVHVRAAEYWLALGKFDEAAEELQRIQLNRRSHPAVTDLQLRIQQQAQANAVSNGEGSAPRAS